jgi:hypothetical protein
VYGGDLFEWLLLLLGLVGKKSLEGESSERGMSVANGAEPPKEY